MANGHTCRICENTAGNEPVQAREMLYGTWDSFEYFTCGKCGSLQIGEALESRQDYEKYYQEPIYRDTASWDTARELFNLPIPTWLVTMIGGPLLSHREVYGEKEEGQDAWEIGIVDRFLDLYLSDHGVDRDWSVLDVGTSEGSFLLSLRKAGFEGSLLGIDPMLQADVEYGAEDVRVARAEVGDLDGGSRFDLITFHHSLACILDPGAAIREAARLLSDRGVCLIRTHVVPNYCWNLYGIHWIGIDPPRNLFLYSPAAVDRLAAGAGLERVGEPRYDSGSFQFWGSEQAKRDVALYSEESFAVSPRGCTVPVGSRMDVYEQSARALNASRSGDMAAFVLKAG